MVIICHSFQQPPSTDVSLTLRLLQTNCFVSSFLSRPISVDPFKTNQIPPCSSVKPVFQPLLALILTDFDLNDLKQMDNDHRLCGNNLLLLVWKYWRFIKNWSTSHTSKIPTRILTIDIKMFIYLIYI